MHPTLFQIGSFKIPSFGAMVMLGFILGLLVARHRAPRFGVTKEQITDVSLWVLIAGILGARLGFILQSIPHYAQNPQDLLQFQFQGMTSFGGLVGGFLALWVGAKRIQKPLIDVLDLASPGLLVGHALGRVGCLLNGCCYGGVCDLPWGIHVLGQVEPHHPAQIYDALMNLAGLALFWFVIDKRTLGRGQAVGFVFMAHGLSRFIYEFWRAGTTSTTIGSLPITEAHVAALVVFAIGLVLWLRRPAAARLEAAS